MKRASAAEVRLRSLTETYVIVPVSLQAVQVACVNAVALYGSELRWNLRQVGR